MPIGPGTRLGQYEVQDFIGQGAMGLVFRAYHSELERTGAVKVMQALSPDADTTARFKHEARAIAQMRHPNIVNVYDFGDYQGTPYMIVEYVPGGSLAGRMSRGMLDQATALRYLRGIAAGLDYAHSKGVVHRDVKPANVLLTADDAPVLADFGLAKLMQGSSLKSMTGVTTGTPAYMAPEQVTGSRVGPAADRYSLATIAYEMLTGVIPFDGEALMELLYAQVHREPPPPSSRNRDLSPGADAVIMRGLAKDPEARWPACGAFVEALAEALRGDAGAQAARTVVVRPVPAPVPAAVPARAVPAAPPAGPLAAEELAADSAPVTLAYPSPPAPAARRSRTGTWVLVTLGLIVVLLIAATAGYVLTRPQPALALTPQTITAGGTLVVTATNLPANQQGEVQLRSALHTVPFQADSNGSVTVYLTVPLDTEAGEHTVWICWRSSCHASASLLVLAAPAPSPSPSPSPSATASATPTAATPGARLLALSTGRVARGGTLSVYGQHFLAVRQVTLFFVQGSRSAEVLPRQLTNSNGVFVDNSFKIPSSAAAGAASVRACDAAGCAYASFQVTS